MTSPHTDPAAAPPPTPAVTTRRRRALRWAIVVVIATGGTALTRSCRHDDNGASRPPTGRVQMIREPWMGAAVEQPAYRRSTVTADSSGGEGPR